MAAVKGLILYSFGFKTGSAYWDIYMCKLQPSPIDGLFRLSVTNVLTIYYNSNCTPMAKVKKSIKVTCGTQTESEQDSDSQRLDLIGV